MTQSITVQNDFKAGLKTEFTGLNFPENACTDTDNVIFTIIGEAVRREGFDYEANFTTTTLNRAEQAISTYKWNNVGGDGSTQIFVQQTGDILNFYLASSATVLSPLSTQLLSSNVNISNFLAQTSVLDPKSVECQFTDGNGYLFIFHPYCDPIYCTYNSATQTITAVSIEIQIRDTSGILEPGVAYDFRPTVLSAEHQYNLENQGWNNQNQWTAVVNFPIPFVLADGTGQTFTVQTGLSISNGQTFTMAGLAQQSGQIFAGTGVVQSYTSGTGTLIVNITNVNFLGQDALSCTFTSTAGSGNTIPAWNTALANYPSNSDVWWNFKNSSGVFAPATTINNVTLDNAQAPQGAFILSAFQQLRSSVSGIAGLTSITTVMRPRTGTWFAGRIWYTGVDASQQATGDAQYYTWTESIYFSQIVQAVNDFGHCYEQNDPTSENLFDLLATDGGVINIQGSGAIYKLFPIQNGLLVFAANGIWYISGSGQAGFTATDYSIPKISSVQSIAGSSYVDVLGLPAFWNEEGLYLISLSKNSGSIKTPDIGLDVNNIALGSILSFYNNIPLQSKKFVKGAYNPIDYTIQWIYKSVNETDITSRYQYDSVLTFNTATQAFYPYSLSNDGVGPWVHAINYIAGPGGSTSPDPVYKYLVSEIINSTSYNFTFAEERDPTFVDWNSSGDPQNYTSYFVTGYMLRGKGLQKFQPEYVYIYSNNTDNTAYKIQGLWDYAINRNSGKYTSTQVVTNNTNINNFNKVFRRHKIRGRGLVLQFKVTSMDGQDFQVMGWSVLDNINASV